MNSGVLGGTPAYLLLKRLGRHISEYESRPPDPKEVVRNRGVEKLESLFGADVWSHIVGKTVIDFGCGGGFEAVEMAKHGAGRVIGVDCRQWVLDHASGLAEAAGLSSILRVWPRRTRTRRRYIFHRRIRTL